MVSGKKDEGAIDFVLTWVDGNDPEWRLEKKRYQPGKIADDTEIRYRDWDNLQYWFRAVEEYASWVNKIHFVTWGHIPSWLNINHPKLNIVKHADYLPAQYLPTFNSHAIELNLHRIKDISEHFVYFNDDTFLNASVKPTDFFVNGKPVDRLIFNTVVPSEETTSCVIFNCVRVINKYFSKRKLLKNCWNKIFYPLYGKDGMKNWMLSPISANYFTGFQNDHIPVSYTKSLFTEVWEAEKDLLEEVTSHRFRSELDVSQYLFRYWYMAQGNLQPCTQRHGKFFNITSNNERMFQAILRGKYKMICCNDGEDIDDFEMKKQQLIQVFNQKFPLKSSFEL